jgi:hypothetical protein
LHGQERLLAWVVAELLVLIGSDRLKRFLAGLLSVFAAFFFSMLGVGAQAPVDPAGWTAVPGREVIVYHRGSHAELARLVLRFLEEQAPLPGLPAGVPRDVSVYLAPDAASFQELLGGRTPEWAAGVAIPQLDRLVLPMYATGPALSEERARVLRHEWAHLGLHQHLAGLRIPRWLDEGYAEWAAGWDAREAWRLRVSMAAGRSPPLDSLTLEWPRDAASAQVAYLLSATAVHYLVDASGERGLAVLLDSWKAGGSFEDALRTTYGLAPSTFELHWRRFVKRRYGWLLLLSNTLALWLAAAVLLVILARIRGRRDRERLARLRARELPDAPAYWSGGEAGGDGEPHERASGREPPGA